MNRRWFSQIVSSPWGIFVLLILLVSLTDLFLMRLMKQFFNPGALTEIQWDMLNALLLAVVATPVLYLLVLRKMRNDLAERNRITRELEIHQRELEEIVHDRTDALAQAKEAAETASLEKSHFLSEISHEIRTPMNAIIGWNYLLQKEIHDPKYQVQLGKMGEAANHLLKIINHMIDLSRIESGQCVLEETDFMLPDLIDQIVERLDEAASDKGLSLRVELDPAIPPQLHADSLRIGQILVNFLTNAIRFSNDGEIVIRTRLEDEIAQRVKVCFEVEDHGVGMNVEQQTRLFQRYAQPEARSMGSTGLGLLITRQLAALMGGEVGVISKLGEGSTFWMSIYMGKVESTLRLADTAKTLLYDHPKSVLLEHYHGSRILLAEDDLFNQEVTCELLNGIGLQVDVAANGKEAVEKVLANHYAIVLMDVQMPVMNGLDATCRIRQMFNSSTLPILALTANASDEDRNECMNAGMNDYIVKPVDPDALYSILLFWLRKTDKK